MLVRGDPVVTMVPGEDPVRQGAVVVEGQVIVKAGPYEELRDDGPFEDVLGGEDFIVIPGLINAHHHAGSTLRAGLQDAPFERRNLFLHLLHPGISEEAVYWTTMWSCTELLLSGVTSALAVYYVSTELEMFGADVALAAYYDSGMRVGFAVAQRDRNLYTHQDDTDFLQTLPPGLRKDVSDSAMGNYSSRVLSNEEYFGLLDDLFERWHGRDDRIFIHCGPDWVPACTDELLTRSRNWATRRGTQVQIHLLETRPEMQFAFHHYGRSAVAHLDRLGFLGPDVVAAHVVWVTPDDVDRLAGHGVTVAHNPASNLRLASGIAPVRAMVERGMSVAIGSDGLAFGDDNDLLSDLRLGSLLQRTPSVRTDPLDSGVVLSMATSNGALALGLGDRLGRIGRGCLADLVLLRKRRLLQPWGLPRLPIEDLLLARARADDVASVLVGGQIVVRDRELKKVDVSAITAALGELSRSRSGPLPLDLPRRVEPYVVRSLDRLQSRREQAAPTTAYLYNNFTPRIGDLGTLDGR